jgi:hypothetical protein
MTNILHQITLTYSAEQDRIMLRISTKQQNEYQLWLTRRFVRAMWDGLLKAIEHDPTLTQGLMPKVKKAIMAMEHQKSIQDSDFSQKHATDNVNLTPKIAQGSTPKLYKGLDRIPPDVEALLVTGAQVKPVNENLTRIKLKTEINTAIEFSLNKKLLHALCHMLVSSTQKAGWGLNLAIGDPRVVIPADANQIH